MYSKIDKNAVRKARHHRMRLHINGTPERPRLNVYRSTVHIYAQVIDVNPFCIPAFRERAALRESLGDTQGAEEDRNALMELSPEEMGEAKSVEEMMKEQSELINPLGL